MEVELQVLDRLDAALALVPLWLRWAQEGGSDYLPEDLGLEAVRGALERSFGAPECLALVARRSGTEDVLGGLLCLPGVEPLGGAAEPWIVALYVEPPYRRRGLARALFRRAREELARRGLMRIAARAGHNDDALISMSERWGFIRRYELLSYD